jgi:hypothetical protein
MVQFSEFCDGLMVSSVMDFNSSVQFSFIHNGSILFCFRLLVQFCSVLVTGSVQQFSMLSSVLFSVQFYSV